MPNQNNNNNTWTKEETDTLLANWAGASTSELTQLLPTRTPEQCASRIMETQTWTDDEIGILTGNYGKVPFDELVRMLPNKTSWQCRDRLLRCHRAGTGIGAKAVSAKTNPEAGADANPVNNGPWTDTETDILRTNWSTVTIQELTRLLPGRSVTQCSHRIVELQVWTDQEVELLIDNYATATHEELKQLLPNKTMGQCYTRASMLRRKGVQGLERRGGKNT